VNSNKSTVCSVHKAVAWSGLDQVSLVFCSERSGRKWTRQNPPLVLLRTLSPEVNSTKFTSHFIRNGEVGSEIDQIHISFYPEWSGRKWTRPNSHLILSGMVRSEVNSTKSTSHFIRNVQVGSELDQIHLAFGSERSGWKWNSTKSISHFIRNGQVGSELAHIHLALFWERFCWYWQE
jgi:phage head maturation protease